MIQLKKILVAIDFSDHSRVALDYAAELARVFDSEVLLCHVVESADILSRIPPGGEGYFPPNLPEIQKQHAEDEIAKLQSELSIARTRVAVPVGVPFLEIIRLAKEEDVDLLIVGTHGRGAIAHMLLGSVAEKIVRKAPCPVLTVRHGEHEFVMP